MAELEIHHHSEEHNADPTGQKVGILAAVLAVALAIVTIASHRTHTAAIIAKSSANDSWAHYQATRMKYHNLELGQSLVKVFGIKSVAGDAMLADDAKQMAKYEKQSTEIQLEAENEERTGERAENRALRYDVGEGLLEIALVLSSLYFISRKVMFPVIGIIAGIAGVAIAATGMFL